MTPYHQDAHLTVWQGDCRAVMAQMPAESVHTVVTSPPYWGLRDYGTATWIGGDDGCDHKPAVQPRATRAREGLTGGLDYMAAQEPTFKNTCGKCGAIRQDSQLGLEPTPEEFVENMVAVFREVRRVLRADGTCWVNLGDSYSGGGGFSPDSPANQRRAEGDPEAWGKFHPAKMERMASRNGTGKVSGLKPKDLVGIPWRVAFALQADGWYLRSDVIWSKPNPMPESVTDRPTKAHEYLFLLTKSARYYYDADAVREPHDDKAGPVTRFGNVGVNGGQQGGFSDGRAEYADDLTRPDFARRPGGREYNPAGRNLRTVWTIATQPYPGAHFATFPEKLVEPCVKAGTSERGVCPECGAPWRRMVERGDLVRDDGSPVKLVDPIKRDASLSAWSRPGGKVETVVPNSHRETITTGWQPSCAHDAEPVPAVVLDPFAGSGTTGRVAQRLGRRAVLIDLSGDYLMQAMARNADMPLGLIG